MGFDTAVQMRRVKGKNGDNQSERPDGSTLGNPGNEQTDWSMSFGLSDTGDLEDYRNPFNFALSQLSVNSTTSYYKVRVFIEDDRYEFYSDDKDLSKATIRGVMHLDDPSISAMFCQKDNSAIGLSRDSKSTLTFYIRKRSSARPGEVIAASASLNFIIVPRQSAVSPSWGAQTPILIDPKIKNDG